MTVELRVLESEQWDEWFSTLERAFGSAVWPTEEREFDRGVTELSRSIAAWDGAEVVGTAGAFSFRMAVPGGAVVPAAGVTMVSVASTHHAARAADLDDAAAAGRGARTGRAPRGAHGVRAA